MVPRILIFLLVALLAGCSSPAKPTASDDSNIVGQANGTTILLPTWQVGDWWTWESPQQTDSYTFVVTSETSSDYFVDTNSPAMAFFDAKSDLSAMGSIRKSDLAGSQGQERVEALRFPLSAHQNWTTIWDGMQVKIHVKSVENGVATLQATREDGTLYSQYTFLESTGHVGATKYYDANGTTITYEAKVSATGTNFSGNVVRYSLVKLIEKRGPMNGEVRTFTVPAGSTDIYAEMLMACTSGAFAIAFGAPTGPADDRGYSEQGQCPATLDMKGVLAPGPAQTEEWGSVLQSTPGSGITLDLTIYARTLVEVPVGPAPSA